MSGGNKGEHVLAFIIIEIKKQQFRHLSGSCSDRVAVNDVKPVFHRGLMKNVFSFA